MKYLIASVMGLVLLTSLANAQAKPKPVVQKPMSKLEKLLSVSALPYHVKNDSLAIIPYSGDHLEDFTVVVQGVSDLYIVYVDLNEAFSKQIPESRFRYLLQQNEHFDFIKIGVTDEGAFYIRADLYKPIVTGPFLKRIIGQVANVTNIISAELIK